MAKSQQRRQIVGMVLYPVDWLEERSGLVGGLKAWLYPVQPPR